jgi:hypothetical protein
VAVHPPDFKPEIAAEFGANLLVDGILEVQTVFPDDDHHHGDRADQDQQTH